MRDLFGRLFESSQIRDCRFALREFGRRLGDEWAWTEIEQKVALSISRERDAIRARMVMDGDLAKHVVGDMIALTCLNDIASGTDHIYRGTLGQVGQSKRNIFASIVTDQLKDGWIDLKEVAVANENMKQAVAEAG